MPRFDYTALTANGKEVHGALEAADLTAARDDLRRRALMPVKLDLEQTGGLLKGGVQLNSFNPLSLLPVSSRDKQFMFRQLALMVKAGHRLRAALEMLQTVTRKRALRGSLDRMINAIDRGESFADALRGEGKLYPKFVPALVAAGERSGTLDRILDEIAQSMERARVLRNSLVRALLLPSITLFVAFGVLAFVVLWLVPVLTQFLIRSGGELHWTMGILVTINEFFFDYGQLMAIIVAVTAFVLLAAYTTEKGKTAIDNGWLRLPLFGRTAIMFETARFGAIGTLLVHAGLRQVESLRVLAHVTQNNAMRNHYDAAADRLLQGQRLADSLESPVFDELARNMVGIGENSGSLDEALDHIGTYYSNEVETRIQVMLSTLVPVLTISVGVVVAIIYISVVLTILGAVNSVR